MLRLSKTKKIVIALAVTGAVAIGSGAAYAFWTTTGSGSGTVTAANASIPLTVSQTSVINSMAPGVGAQTLSGKFTNTNTYPVYVTNVAAVIGTVTGGCTAGDFSLVGSPMAVGHEVAIGTNIDSWTGATIVFVNKGTNQDNCKGTTVTINYTAN